MKKLLILASVCAMAFASQAYSFKWGPSNVRVPAATDPTKSQTGIKVTSSSPAFGGDYGSLEVTLYWLGKDGATQHLITSVTATGASVTPFEVFSDSSTLYSDIVDVWGTSDKPNFLVTASYTDKNGTYDFKGVYAPTKGLGNLASGNITMATSMTNGTWDYTAKGGGDTPEPTSGLLLLLGVAGLALRRKQA